MAAIVSSTGKAFLLNLAKCNKSLFTLSFAIEIDGLEMIEDHNEQLLELPEPPVEGMKIQYQLFYGQIYEIEIAIYPHCAKVLSASSYCWVRTWQFMERRWLTFTISHSLPVRVEHFIDFEATIEPMLVGVNNLSARAKEKPSSVCFHPLPFKSRHYFQRVSEVDSTAQEKLNDVFKSWVFGLIQEFIPPLPVETVCDVPNPAKDIRHQDAIFYHVQDAALKRKLSEEEIDIAVLKSMPSLKKFKSKKSYINASQTKSLTSHKKRYGLKLSGDAILAGVGRIIPFEPFGEMPPGVGSIIAVISSGNLPAQDDVPIMFMNIETLFNAPLEEFRKLGITHLYTRWYWKDKYQDSQLVDITSNKLVDEVKFNDHHAKPVDPSEASSVISMYLDKYEKIELRGQKSPTSSSQKVSFFGFDRSINSNTKLPIIQEQLDFLIANTRIDSRYTSKGINLFDRGEYCLFPPDLAVEPISRELLCTNDINKIGMPLKPVMVVSASTILLANMTLEVSMGFVGCRPRKLISSFSRLYCHVKERHILVAILNMVKEVNMKLAVSADDMLTGFAIDTGDVVIIFMEGERYKHILKIWEMTADFYPKINPVFSSKMRYSSRVYPELLQTPCPFLPIKAKAPLGLILACPAVYARPALPLPARSALLKLGQLIQMKHRTMIPKSALPSTDELLSFRLELCAPPLNTAFEATQFFNELREVAVHH